MSIRCSVLFKRDGGGFLGRARAGRFVRRALGRAGREITESDVDPVLGFASLLHPPLPTHQ
jgi:hypothetical protein